MKEDQENMLLDRTSYLLQNNPDTVWKALDKKKKTEALEIMWDDSVDVVERGNL